MTVIGAILVVLCGIVILAVVFGGGSPNTAVLDLGPVEIDTSPEVVFWLGALTAFLLLVGAISLYVGMKRSQRRRKELKEAREVVAEHERRSDTPEAESESDTPGDTAD